MTYVNDRACGDIAESRLLTWNANDERSGVGAADGGAPLQPSLEIVEVPIEDLLPADSPRMCGEDEEHARTLAQSDALLPPILVHRPTMRVIDGMHRLQALLLRGSRTIRVRFFDGNDRDAFVVAVRSNIAHGKPLTLAEREAATRRILDTHADWSDRAIASVCGISSKTVGSLRHALGTPGPSVRVGLDGRVRPLDTTDARQRAAQLLTVHPEASLREVARAAGISPGTVRDVRLRMRRGVGPVPRRIAERAAANQAPFAHYVGRVTDDTTLRSGDAGQKLVEWLEAKALRREDWEPLVESVPLSRLYVVADAARACAAAWTEFADALEARSRRKSSRPVADWTPTPEAV